MKSKFKIICLTRVPISQQYYICYLHYLKQFCQMTSSNPLKVRLQESCSPPLGKFLAHHNLTCNNFCEVNKC